MNEKKQNITGVEAINDILDKAVSFGASDIHCDPRDRDILIRFRVDGIIISGDRFDKHIHEEMIARLKILSGARTDIHAIPQDGRWQANILDETYNIRISFMPTYHGENAVLRILPVKQAGQMSFAKLGFTPEHVEKIDRALNKTSGLILVTGPTGSGKTTTLYTCLSLKAKEPISIITLEDPIEYEIDGLRQVHVRHNHGVTFATGLRASLRQDPDVIMVGEIRDNETAKIAIHTALTGHLVFSTLHTNSALEAIPRLIDMGIDNYLLASTLKLIISQRLVRTICRECFAQGCDVCKGSGYSGRIVISEICEIDRGLSDLIGRKESLSVCKDYVLKRGFRSLNDDGLEKVEWGITSKDELSRVFSE